MTDAGDPLLRLDELLQQQKERRQAARSALERHYAELGEFIYREAYPAFHEVAERMRARGKHVHILYPDDETDPRTLGILIFSNDGPEFRYEVGAQVVPERAFIMKRYLAYQRQRVPPVYPRPTEMVSYALVGDKAQGRSEDQNATNVTKTEIEASVVEEYEKFSRQWEQEQEIERRRNENTF